MRRYRGLVVGSVVIVVGCRQILGIDEPSHEDAQGPPDAPSCYGDTSNGSLITVCLQPTIGNGVLNDAINTDTDGRCASLQPPIGPEVCVIEAVDVTIQGQITVTGKRPLVIVGTHTISITATAVLDASSKLGLRSGPDSNDMSCTPGTGAGSGGGGAGGSFGAQGGNGGSLGDRASGPQIPMFVRGGCAGSTGTATGQLGGSGPGGGAVYLIAGRSIQVDGVIVADGAGGRVGLTGLSISGGGGGGAGGLIGLDAPMVSGSGEIMAVGAGGGEGSPGSTGSAANGDDPSGKFSEIAKGGAISDSGGNGGNGGGFGLAATNGGSGSGSGSDIGGGGGGGGSVGVVWVRSSQFNVMNVSPPKRP